MLIIDWVKPLEETRILSQFLYIYLTKGLMSLIKALDFILPLEPKLSGHRSKTQKQIGMFFNFFNTIAGIHTVIGDGS